MHAANGKPENARGLHPAAVLLKGWEEQRTFFASWDAPFSGTPAIVVLSVGAREPSTHGRRSTMPTQRDPEHFILVEKYLRFIRADDGEIEKASIELRYARVWGGQANFPGEARGSMNAGYSRELNTISLAKTNVNGTTGAVFLSMQGGIPRGVRIGTYLMNEIVVWARHWPDAHVQPISLVGNQGLIDVDRNTRNAFWRKFGLTLEFDDPEGRSGHSLPMKAGELTSCTTWTANITVVPLLKFAAQQQEGYALERCRNDQLSRNAEKFEARRRKERRHPFCWAWKIFFETRIEGFLGKFAGLTLAAGLTYAVGRSLSWWG